MTAQPVRNGLTLDQTGLPHIRGEEVQKSLVPLQRLVHHLVLGHGQLCPRGAGRPLGAGDHPAMELPHGIDARTQQDRIERLGKVILRPGFDASDRAVELVQGVSLARLMKTIFDTGEAFTERMVVYIASRLCRGLAAADAYGRAQHVRRGGDAGGQ